MQMLQYCWVTFNSRCQNLLESVACSPAPWENAAWQVLAEEQRVRCIGADLWWVGAARERVVPRHRAVGGRRREAAWQSEDLAAAEFLRTVRENFRHA